VRVLAAQAQALGVERGGGEEGGAVWVAEDGDLVTITVTITATVTGDTTVTAPA